MTKFYLLLLVSCFYICFSNSLSAQTNEVNYRNWVRTNQTNKSKKAALVIGNSLYQHVSQLSEPAKDAQTIANALQTKGYDILICYNLNRDKLYEVIDEFIDEFRSYDEIIIAYAGHGFQIDGVNYIIPIDAKLDSKRQVSGQCMDIKYIYKAINFPQKTKLIVFDACRENPFERKWASTDRLILPEGMDAIMALQNSLSIFSTQENTSVSDYNQFMEFLSQEIEKGGCLDDILRAVSRRVKDNDSNQQINVEGLLDYKLCFEKGEKNEFISDSGTFTDTRDGQSYKWIRLKDGKVWMVENLNYKTSNSWCYDNMSSNCQKYGRLYTWKAAMKACPNGWRLPTIEEWDELFKLYKGSVETLIIGDSSKLSILFGGFRTSFGSFHDISAIGRYWSSTVNFTPNIWSYQFIHYYKTTERTDLGNITANSCRCIHN